MIRVEHFTGLIKSPLFKQAFLLRGRVPSPTLVPPSATKEQAIQKWDFLICSLQL
jgi:hypothetical protein